MLIIKSHGKEYTLEDVNNKIIVNTLDESIKPECYELKDGKIKAVKLKFNFIKHVKSKKKIIFKKLRRKNSKKKVGHIQQESMFLVVKA